MQKKEQLSESLEDYLEEIFELSRTGPARVRDIASRLDVTMASVSGAMKKLRQKGLIMAGRYDYIALTPEGEVVARKVSGRHQALFGFLTDVLGLDSELAQEDACRIEHALSPETLERLKEFQEFFEGCEPAIGGWKVHLAEKKK